MRNAMRMYRYQAMACCFWASLGISLLSFKQVRGAEVDWNVPNGDWTEGSNWLGGTPPTGSDNVFVKNGGSVSLKEGDTGAYKSLSLGDASKSGSMQINGGNLSGTDATIGDGGQGTVTLQNGNWTNSHDTDVGKGAQGNGLLTVNGGTLSTQYLEVGESGGKGSVVINGGVVNASKGVDIGDINAGTQGSVELNGGTLKARRVVGSNACEKATFTFNGGTLQATASDTYFIQGFKDGSLQIGSGGGTIDTNGYSVGVQSQLGGTGNGNFNIINTNPNSAGKVTYYVPATYTATTNIGNNAILAQGVKDAFSANSSVNIAQHGTLDLGGYDGKIGGLSGAGEVTSTGAGNVGLTIGANNADGNFTGTISDGANGTLKLIKTGSGTQYFFGQANYTGGTEIDGGKLVGNTDSLKRDIVNKATLGFAQDKDGVFDGSISGSGNVEIDNANTDNRITFNTNQAYTGETIINKGTLEVNSELATSQVTVNDGGVLMGTGIVDHDVQIQKGGWMRPGGDLGPGTFTIKGNYTQNEGGNVVFRIGGLNNYDHMQIDGSAKLSGSIHAVDYNHFIPPNGSVYNVIHTEKGINGTRFTNENIDTPLKLYAQYTDKDVNLITKQEDFVPWSNLTPAYECLNKALLDSVITAKGSLHDALADLEFTPKDSIMPYLNQLLPRAAMEVKEVLFNNANTQYGQITERLADIRAGVGAVSLNGLSQEPMQQQSSAHEQSMQHHAGDITYQEPAYGEGADNRWDVFATGSGIFSRINTAYDLPTMHTITGNFTAGADYKLSEHADVGVFCGYEGFDTQFADSSWFKSNGVRFGLYGTTSWNGFYLNALVGAAFNSLGMARVVDMRGISCEGDHWVARGDTSTAELDGLLGGGYEYALGNWRFGANVSAQYTYLNIGGYQERGADTLNLQVDEQNTDSLKSTVGANISYVWQITPSIKLMPSLGLAWQHEYLDYSQDLYSAFCNGAGAWFYMPTVEGERDDAFGTLGISAQIGEHFGAYCFYNPVFGGSQVVSHGVILGVNYSF